jgi:hypothetical protein
MSNEKREINVDDAFAKMLDRAPTDAEKIRLYKVRDALGLKNNDALWLVLIALDSYERLYEGIPTKISEAANAASNEATTKARANIEGELAKLIPSMRNTLAQAVQDVAANESLGQSYITLALAAIMVSGAFAVGLLYGSDLIRYFHEGKISAWIFWEHVAWGTAAGVSLTTLLTFLIARVTRYGRAIYEDVMIGDMIGWICAAALTTVIIRGLIY